MKKIIFIFILSFVFFLVACNTPEQKAEKLINRYLKEQKHKWVKTDSLWVSQLYTVENDDEYKSIPQLNEWRVGTSFLSTDNDGKTEVQLYEFYFDEDITKITNIRDFEKESQIRKEKLSKILEELDTE